MTQQRIPLKIPRKQTQKEHRRGSAKISFGGKFSNAYKATIGADFQTSSAQIGDKNIKFQFWDTGK